MPLSPPEKARWGWDGGLGGKNYKNAFPLERLGPLAPAEGAFPPKNDLLLAPAGDSFPRAVARGGFLFPAGLSHRPGGILFSGSGAARVNPPPEHWTQARKFASIAAKQKPRGKTFSEKDISMQVCIAIMHGNPVLLELRDGIPHINGEAQPIKQLTEEKLAAFQQELDAIPQGDDEAGYAALVNAKRAAFIVDMLGHAVGDECVNLLTHILDHVHYDVMEYLGETEDA